MERLVVCMDLAAQHPFLLCQAAALALALLDPLHDAVAITQFVHVLPEHVRIRTHIVHGLVAAARLHVVGDRRMRCASVLLARLDVLLKVTPVPLAPSLGGERLLLSLLGLGQRLGVIDTRLFLRTLRLGSRVAGLGRRDLVMEAALVGSRLTRL